MDITIKVDNSSNYKDDVYGFYWRLFKKYFDFYNSPVFFIPYVLVKSNSYVAASLEVDLNCKTLGTIYDELNTIENMDSFVGFQI